MADSLHDIIALHAGSEGPLLPILHDVQSALGFIPENAMRQIADALNITRAEVWGVISFYHDFRTEPAPLPQVRLCRAEACQARGVETLVSKLDEADKARIKNVYCLGLCSVGPAAMMGDGAVHARLNGARLKALLEAGA